MALNLQRLVVLRPKDELESFKQGAAIGQKRTASFKPLVYMKDGVVVKGPYSMKQRSALLLNTLFRQKLFGSVWTGGCSVAGPFQLVCYGTKDEVYLRMPHLGVCESEWKGTLETIIGENNQLLVAEKKSQCLVEFSAYLDQQHMEIDVIVDALIHYMHRFICDPIVGDAALRNVLIRCVPGEKHKAFGIDFEENRTGDLAKRAAELGGSIFDMIEGGKKWKQRIFLAGVIVNHRERVLNHLNEINGKWSEVDQLAEQCFVPHISRDNMKKRLLALKKSIEALSSNTISFNRPIPVKRKLDDEKQEKAKEAKIELK